MFRETVSSFPVARWDLGQVCPYSKQKRSRRRRERKEEGGSRRGRGGRGWVFLEKPEHLAEGWRLRAGVRRERGREDLSWSREKRERCVSRLDLGASFAD